MRRGIQTAVQGMFYTACISVALIFCSLPSLVTGPF